MIFVAGSMTIAADQVDAIEAAIRAMVGGVRQEPGCIHYSLLIEDRAAGTINVLEMWDSEDLLKQHLALPTTQSFFARFGSLMTAMDVQVYDAVNARPVPL